jgi:hypothetical protein
MNEKYFGKTMPINIKLQYPTDFSSLFISLKKEGEKINQYVTTIRYRDLLSWNSDYTKISLWTIDDIYQGTVWSNYHSDCKWCLEFEKEYKSNLIYGIRIYPASFNHHKQQAYSI